MKNQITLSVNALASKAAKITFYIAGAVGVLTFGAHAQIFNGSFEDGLTGWNTTPGDFIIGHDPSQPIGTDGYYSADLGGGDVTGAVLSQTINNFANGGVYQLSYDSACNAGDVLSLVSVWEVVIIANGQQIAAQTLSQQNVGQPAGSFGFVHRQMDFTVAPSVQNITISFEDMTPNGGVGIDTALDLVQVVSVPEPDSAAIAGLAVVVGAITRVWRRRMPGDKEA